MIASEREVPTIVTHVAHAGFGELYLQGHRVFAEFAGRMSMSGMMALAISGLVLDETQCGVLDDITVCMALADPRVWPLKVSRLVACYGSAQAGTAGAILCCDMAAMGPAPVGEVARVLAAIAHALGPTTEDDPDAVEREALRILDREGRLPGFGLPGRRVGRTVDERVVAMRRCFAQRGFRGARFLRLAEVMGDRIRRARDLEPNAALLLAGAILDLGFPLEHVAPIMAAVLHPTILGNAVEEMQLKSTVLRRLPDGCVHYEGVPPRESPRARAAVGR